MRKSDWVVVLIVIILFVSLFIPFFKSGFHITSRADSCSMMHFTEFDEWWEGHKGEYARFNITKRDFLDFTLHGGYTSGVRFIMYVPLSFVEVGDIIGFPKNGRIITHRVVKRWKEDTKLMFQTLGDNNDIEDQPISEGEYLGKVFTVYAKVNTKGFEGCRLIESEECKKKCYLEVEHEVAECNSLTGLDKDLCLFGVEGCSLILNQSLKDECFFDLGTEKNVKYCAEIKENTTKDACYLYHSRFGLKVVDKEDCDSIVNDELKERCYEIV